MNDAIHAIGWTLVHFVWQGAVIGLLAAALLWMLRDARPGQRYASACAALLACLLWPAWQLAGAWRTTGQEASAQADAAIAYFASHGELLSGIEAQLPLIVGAWLVCMLALALRSALGLAWIARARSSGALHQHWQHKLTSMAARLGIRRNVALRVVDTLASPITAGWWRPVVLVPAALVARMPPELLEALLAHELAHVRRHDYLVNLLQNVVETLLFYHPAVWWLSRRIRQERELVADGLATELTGEPRNLALALSELEKMQFASRRLALAADGGDLMQRVRQLVRPQPVRSAWKALLPALGLAAACLTGYADARVGAALPPPEERAVVDFNSCRKPVWPHADLEAGHTGKVTLSFMIDQDGKVRQSRVLRSSGHRGLDRAAQTGIGKCSFIPAKSRGKPVVAWNTMQYHWLLE